MICSAKKPSKLRSWAPDFRFNKDRAIPYGMAEEDPNGFGMMLLHTAYHGTFRIRRSRIVFVVSKRLRGQSNRREIDLGPPKKGQKWPTSAKIATGSPKYFPRF